MGRPRESEPIRPDDDVWCSCDGGDLSLSDADEAAPAVVRIRYPDE